MDFKDFIKESATTPTSLSLNVERLSPKGLADELLPVLVQMAHVEMERKRRAHETKYGPRDESSDAYNFDDSPKEYLAAVDSMIDQLRDVLGELKPEDIKASIKSFLKLKK